MGQASTLVWFRQDLRIADNPALTAACRREGVVIPVFIWSPDEENPWAAGSASRYWLHQSLCALDKNLRTCGSRLIVRKGPVAETLAELANETGARTVCWNRRYEPAALAQEQRVRQQLEKAGIAAVDFNGALLFEPWEIATKDGKPYQVFTAFWKACLAKTEPDAPAPAPDRINAPAAWPDSETIESLALEPTIPWAEGIARAWTFGEEAAHERLDAFLADAMMDYKDGRDRPGVLGTSRLSPHLHFGEIGPRQIWHAVRNHAAGMRDGKQLDAAQKYLAEIGWREFSHHLLYHFPAVPESPLRQQFLRFPWADDKGALVAWQKGRTGYPIVDAGMRELWTTGWMHNRVRMIVASFLTKDLLIPWQRGAQWFWDTLVDADLASNTQGWQWTAGCGADAAPYFRIFNPTSQGEKFDPSGDYVRQWVPEIAALPNALIHRPWEASAIELAGAGIRLGETYPFPLVDHGEARKAALAAYGTITGK